MGHGGRLVVTVTVLVDVLTVVVVLVTVLLDGAWVLVGASVVEACVWVGDSVTVSVLAPVPGEPDVAVLAPGGVEVADVPAGLVPVPVPVNLTTA